jgi:hypothetical protein
MKRRVDETGVVSGNAEAAPAARSIAHRSRVMRGRFDPFGLRTLIE